MPVKHLKWKPYIDQQPTWPDRGRVIMAQYDDQSVVVYQAYRPQIGLAAAAANHFEVPGFSLERMTWIKPNFLWMMHRSDWATNDGQEVILAIWIQRPAFDQILAAAVHSHYEQAIYQTHEAWQQAIDQSEVRMQWDPDYPPRGPKLNRRAIQLGLGGETLRRYAREWIIHIEDITEIVHQQAEIRHVANFLLTPAERIYPVRDQTVAARLGLDKSNPD